MVPILNVPNHGLFISTGPKLRNRKKMKVSLSCFYKNIFSFYIKWPRLKNGRSCKIWMPSRIRGPLTIQNLNVIGIRTPHCNLMARHQTNLTSETFVSVRRWRGGGIMDEHGGALPQPPGNLRLLLAALLPGPQTDNLSLPWNAGRGLTGGRTRVLGTTNGLQV